jgi:hypothetical protein
MRAAAVCFLLCAGLLPRSALADEPKKPPMEITVVGPASPATPTSSAASAALPVVPASDLSARLEKRWVLSVQLGFNTLAGLGLAGSYMATEHLAFDAALGIGLSGRKIGARGRWNFTTGNWAPFAAAGLIHATGLPQAVEFKQDAEQFHYTVGSATWLQLAAGLDAQAPGDWFVVRLEGGWVVPLQDEGIAVVDGNPSSSSLDAIRVLTRGKLVLGLSLGAAF